MFVNVVLKLRYYLKIRKFNPRQLGLESVKLNSFWITIFELKIIAQSITMMLKPNHSEFRKRKHIRMYVCLCAYTHAIVKELKSK